MSSISICAPSAAVVAYGVRKFAAAMKAKRKIRQKMARANGAFVRMEPRNSTNDTRVLRGEILVHRTLGREREGIIQRHIVHALARVVRHAVGARNFALCIGVDDADNRIFTVGDLAPVAAVDDEDGKGEGCGAMSVTCWQERHTGGWNVIRTVTEDELADTGDVHGDPAEEEVRAADGGKRYSRCSQ